MYSEATGDSHWYTDSSLYRLGYEDVMEHIENDVDRSDEEFIRHYYENYDYPSLPPCWMAFEITSLANLSRIYQALILDDKKKFIAKSFGLPKVEILENWLHAFTDLRNSCAHHNRIWNRRFMINIKLPYNPTYAFMDRVSYAELRTNKLFVFLSCIAYILNIISPDNDFKNNLKRLLKSDCTLLSLKDMGFPKNWTTFAVWR